MDMSGPVAIFLFFLLLLVDMFFYGFDAAIDNLNEKEILHKAEEEKDRRSMRLSEMISRPGDLYQYGTAGYYADQYFNGSFLSEYLAADH